MRQPIFPSSQLNSAMTRCVITGAYFETVPLKNLVNAVVMKLTLPSSRLPGYIVPGADLGLGSISALFPVPEV